MTWAESSGGAASRPVGGVLRGRARPRGGGVGGKKIGTRSAGMPEPRDISGNDERVSMPSWAGASELKPSSRTAAQILRKVREPDGEAGARTEGMWRPGAGKRFGGGKETPAAVGE